jgi:hypothetical protein
MNINRIKKHIKDNAIEYTTLALSAVAAGIAITYLNKENDEHLVTITKEELKRMNNGESLVLLTDIGNFTMHTLD